MDITRERMLAEIQAVVNERKITDLMTDEHIKRLHDDSAGVIREALAEARKQEGQK